MCYVQKFDGSGLFGLDHAGFMPVFVGSLCHVK